MMTVFVLRTKWLGPELIELLMRLLEELGFVLELLDLLDAEDGNDELHELGAEDVLLVVVSDDLDTDAGASATIKEVAHKGVRVAGVWPPGRTDPHLPAVLEKTASGAVPCDREGLEKLLCGAGGETWLEPDGKSRPVQTLERGGC